jgi:Tol biopolymer transport system component
VRSHAKLNGLDYTGAEGTRMPTTSVSRSAWSHDGQAIAFTYLTQCDSEAGRDSQSAVVARDGTRQQSFGYGERPQWTNDDRAIVFLLAEADDLVRLAAHTRPLTLGGDVRTIDGRNVREFSLAPAFRLVAYTLTNDRREPELWIANVDGSRRRPLLRDRSVIDPAWRPQSPPLDRRSTGRSDTGASTECERRFRSAGGREDEHAS